CIQALDFPYSF
nr:immunoglobulin light chain junction region [Macaca mulatta]